MRELNEKTILCKGLFYIFIPIVTFGGLSMYFPGFYALFPVQESAVCICSFLVMQENGNPVWLLDLSHNSFETLTLANSISFYVVNWIALVVLIWLIFRIRHTGDDTHLKRECMAIVGVWVFASILQYIVFIFNFVVTCRGDEGTLTSEQIYERFEVSYKIVYWLIIIRDITCHLIMVLFQYQATTSQLYFNRLLDINDKDSTRIALQDFEMLLVSVIPHKAFSRFLHEEKPEMIPYLQMVHLCKLYQDDLEVLQDLKYEKQRKSVEIAQDS